MHGLGANPFFTWTTTLEEPIIPAAQAKDPIEKPDSPAHIHKERGGISGWAVFAKWLRGLSVGRKKARMNWLESLLPAEFPMARILLFMYNADWYGILPTVPPSARANILLDELRRVRGTVSYGIVLSNSISNKFVYFSKSVQLYLLHIVSVG